MPELHNIVEIVRKINAHIIDTPDVIKTEGVMRISGTKSKRQAITEQVLNNEPLVNVSVHELADVYKQYLQFEPSIIINALSEFKDYKKYADILASSSSDVNACRRVILDTINQLAHSDDIEQLAVLEIIYSYLYLATKIAAHSDNNKMGAKQMGVILGPFISTLFNVVPTTHEHAGIFNQACQNLIKSAEFNLSYATKFPTQNLKAVEIQIELLKKSEKERREQFQKVEIFSEKLTKSLDKTNNELKMLNHSLETLETNPKNNKKQIKQIKASIDSQHKTLQQTLQIASGYKNMLHNEKKLVDQTVESIKSLDESYIALGEPGRLEKEYPSSSSTATAPQKRASPIVNKHQQQEKTEDKKCKNKEPKQKIQPKH